MPAPRVSTCIFCDDVRYEMGNKISLIGVYNSDIIFPANPPLIVPKLGIVVWIVTDIDDIPTALSLRITVPPNETEIFKAQQVSLPTLQHREDAQKATFRNVLGLGPIPLTAEGFLEVWVDSGQGETRAGRIFLRFAGPLIQAETQVAPTEQGGAPAA